MDILFDPRALRTELTALAHANSADPDGLRLAVLDRLKALTADAHTQTEADLFEHGSGSRAARSLSHFQDELLRLIHDFTIHHVYRAKNPSEAEKLAIVAVGGYGRGTLAPHSDIDLLFLHPYKLAPWAESVIEYVLYLLWDLKFKVGHATRTVDQCLRLAGTDLTVRTAILEARFLWGHKPLFTELTRRFNKEMVAGARDEFIASKLTEREQRHARAGESRYLVEPNVKEGKGGLRDLHSLFWIGKYLYRPKTLDDLVAAGLFTRGELARFRKANDFLWAVRCHLHFLAGRAEERLTFERQPELARRLGYASRVGLSAVERFMKHYFLTAKEVGDLTRIVCAALEERELKQQPVLDRVLGTIGIRRTTTLEHGFVAERGRLKAGDKSIFTDDPVNLIRLFHVAMTHNLLLHPALVQRVSRSLSLIDDQVQNDAEANRLFLEILTARSMAETVLRRMNETGVLGRFVPDFGRVVSMMQFSLYHHFTVDEHLLRSVGILNAIEDGDHEAELPLSNEIIHTIENRRALYVAAFLHDIAKGRPEDHSDAGAAITRAIGPRFGLTAAETDTAAWLVQNHLVMSDVAQRRDLFDPRTIEDFATLMQSPERLKLLLVLTVADIRAVGSGVWTGWKGELLRTLYYETEPVLAGGHTGFGRAARARTARDAFVADAAVHGADADQAKAFTDRLGDPYWLSTDLPRQRAHAALIADAEAAQAKFQTAIETDAFTASTEISVYTPDHARLLSFIAGSCAVAGANIVSAQIVTTVDGWALDTVTISRDFDTDDEIRRAGGIARTAERSLRGEIRLFDAVQDCDMPRARGAAFPVTPQVVITNSLSDHFTVIEVAARDRPGLLFDLTRTISDLSLNIRSAHIVTFGERAVDVFYVRDLYGHRIENPDRQARARAALMAALDVDGDTSEITQPTSAGVVA